MQSIQRALIAAAIALMAFGASQAMGPSNETARLVLAAALACHLFMLLHAIAAPGDRSLGIVSGLYHSLLFIFPGMLQAANGWFPFFSKTYPTNFVLGAAALVLAYSISLVTLYCLPRHGSLSERSTQGSAGSVHYRRASLVACALALIAISGFVVLGPDHFLTRRGDLLHQVSSGSPLNLLLNNFFRVAGFLALAAALLVWIDRKSRSAAILCFGSAVVFLAVNNPVNVPRFQLLGPLICLVFICGATTTVRFKTAFAAAFTISILTIFPFLSGLSRGGRGAALWQNPLDYYVRTVDFDGFQSVINVYAMVQSHGLALGHRLASALLVLIPRSVWPGKANPTGSDAALYAGYKVTNISAPAPAELFADFGWVGVALGAALIGWALARTDALASRQAYRGSPRLLIGTLIGFLTILLRGSLLGVIAQTVLALLMAYAVQRFITTASAASPKRVAKGSAATRWRERRSYSRP